MKKTIPFFILFIFSLNVYSQHYDYKTDHVCKQVHNGQDLLNLKHRAASLFYDDYDVKFYFLDITVENNSIYVEGNATTVAEILVDNLDVFTLELIDVLTVDSAIVDGVQQSFTHNNDEIDIDMPPKNAGDMVSVKVYYHGTPIPTGFFSGISTSTEYVYSESFDVTWTLSEPFNAKQWWPCKQDLQDQADSSWCFVTTSNTNMVGSNGLLTATTTMPNNKVRYEWKTKYPMNFYLISLSVSDYQDYSLYAYPDELPNDSILIQNYIYDNSAYLINNKDDIDETADMIELFSEKYSLYPFWEEKYGHCISGIGGGMEHQTMTTQGCFSHTLTAHELGHQWFGDNVTCATWSDIWVNEGFATYSEYLSLYNLVSYSAAQQEMEGNHSSTMSLPGGSIYIPPAQATDVWRIFNSRLSYNKGSAFVHMIRFELQDDDLFFQCMQDYQTQYGGSVATGDDFKNVVETTSGMQFDDFFDQWYYGEGYPTFSYVWWWHNDEFHLESTQTTSTTVTPLFKMLMEYKLSFTDNTDTTVYLYQTDNFNEFVLSMEKEVKSIEVDPDNWVINKVGSIVIGVDEIDGDIQFNVAPNPAENYTFLFFGNKLLNGEGKYSVFDMTGRIVLQNKITQKKESIDISSFQSGTYFVTVEIDGKKVVRKLIVK